MTALAIRLSRLLADGHTRDLADLRSDARFAPAALRAAAVLIAVTDRSEPGVILTHRPAALRTHPGQVAFPGGKLDPGEDPLAAALREAHEEMGISPSDVTVIGMTDGFITATGYDVAPVLGVVPHDINMVPNPSEVAGWFEAPLAFLLDPANHQRRVGEFGGQPRPYLEIEWQGHRIWGVTAAIIANLSRRISWQEIAHGQAT